MAIKSDDAKRFAKKTNAEKLDRTTSLDKGNRAQRKRGKRGGESY